MKLTTYLTRSQYYSSLILFAVIVSHANSVSAQTSNIVPDGTLGRESSVVNSRDTNSDRIDGGAIRGQNLFHSFQEFNVDAERGAYFSNPNDVTNIFSRVTGNNLSNILGTLGVDGAADLFLINPNGIVFGEDARLDVQGSFTATTASGVEFDEQGLFSAANPQSSVLTISVPLGLQFGSDPGSIIVRGDAQGTRGSTGSTDLIDTQNALRVNSGETFALVGGNLLFEGATIKTAGGRIELGSLEGNEKVDLTPTNESFSFDYDGVQNFRDIQLSQTATVDASGEGGGNIQVQGRNITLTDGSTIEASTLGSLPGGTVQLTSSDSVNIDGFNESLINSAIVNRVYDDASGNGGNINITTRNLNITDGAEIQGGTSSTGNAGIITLNIFESINLSSFLDFPQDDIEMINAVYVQINSGVGTESTGNGGDLLINTRNFTISGNVQLGTETSGEGKAGNININASGFLEMRENSLIDSEFPTLIAPDVQRGSKGNGGDLTIKTPYLNLIGENTTIATGTQGEGNGGATFINVQQLNIAQGAELQSLSFGNEASGSSGSITIEASEAVNIRGSSSTIRTIREDGTSVNIEGVTGGIFSSAIGGTGNGGNLTINTNKLVVQDFGTVNVSNFQTLDLVPPGKGAAGNLEINANSIEVNNGTITAANANGIGGELFVNANSLILANGSSISAETTANTGTGGNVSLNINDSIQLRDNSMISAQALDNADGGNITLTADSIIAFDDSDIFAFAEEGEGGNINLDTPAFFAENFTLNSLNANPETLENNNRADVNATGAVSGAVSIPDVSFIQNSLNDLPDNSINTNELVANSCVAPVGNRQQGKFIITGGDSLPVRPGNSDISNFATGEVQGVSEVGSGWQRGDAIVEPQGMYRLANGKLVLSQECS